MVAGAAAMDFKLKAQLRVRMHAHSPALTTSLLTVATALSSRMVARSEPTLLARRGYCTCVLCGVCCEQAQAGGRGR